MCDLLRKIAAYSSFVGGVSIFGHYMCQSAKLWFQAVTWDFSMADQPRLARRMGIEATIGIVLLWIGLVLLAPEIGSSLVCGVVIAVLIGGSVWRDILLRQRYARERRSAAKRVGTDSTAGVEIQQIDEPNGKN